MADWGTVAIVDPVKAMLVKIWGFIPTITGAILILVCGWLIAKLLETIVVKVLKAIKLDMASEKAGVANVLAQGDIKITLSELIGGIIYWLIMLVVAVTVLNALNLAVAANLLSRLVEYVPNILAAIFVLVLGSFLATFVSAVVRTTANNAGVKNSKFLSQISQTIIVIFSVIIAVEQLNIATAFIALTVNIILASLGLGIALAFGLGCKDMVGKMVADYMNKMK
ncbi:MAG: hypothetical protein JW919_03805 [Candidatus Omnitrophica bacterium]|nr:hypothetical protein [Candidatus Omnitrophota bacterium]